MIDGPVLVAEALAAGLEVATVFLAGDADPEVRSLAQRAAAGVGQPFEITPDALASAVDPVTPNGIAAIARRPDRSLATLALGPDAVIVVLDRVADPGNAGTILRSAEASGANAVIALAGSVDLFAPKVVRSAAGALFRLPVVADIDGAALRTGLRAGGLRLVGTVAAGGTDYVTASLGRGVALFVGNEAHGIDPALAGFMDEWVTIPMAGPTESLNVAMAATLLCFESARQRRAAE